MFKELIKPLMKQREKEIFEGLIRTGQIETAVCIMHPKYKRLIAESELNIDVVFSEMCPENTAFMVIDDCLKRNIKEGERWAYQGEKTNK